MSTMLLVGDIGGTKTDLALVRGAADAHAPAMRRRFHSADYPGLDAIAREFIAQIGAQITHACFDVAGPVVDGRAHLTNLPWEVSAVRLGADLHLQDAWVINDLAAVAHAIPLLGAGDVHCVNAGERVAHGAMAVIAPGTGLGEGYAVWDGVAYRGYPSEGGHADFAATTPAQAELLSHLQQRFDHVSYELVCSGRGLPHLYDFFRDTACAPESPELAAKLAAADDRTPLIVEGALRDFAPDALCAAALDTFVTVLGAEAGNLALKVLATGGVFLGGGIPPRILPLLDDGRFVTAFRRKGRFTDLLTRMPIHVITAENAALIGAASYGLARIGADASAAGKPARG